MMSARAISVRAGHAAKNASIARALAAPSPGTAFHHWRRRGTRTVRSASVPMRWARSARTARGANHWVMSSVICGAGGRAVRSLSIACATAFACRTRSSSG
jgi:hypothetical protein